jgi:hypothetical protein
MSEATALERSPDSTSIRRWPRYKVNVPIRVIVSRAMKASIFDGRGTSLSEGGLALFAGAELRMGDQVASNLLRPFLCLRYGWRPKCAIGPAITTGRSFWRSTLPRDSAWINSACIWRALPPSPEPSGSSREFKAGCPCRRLRLPG